MAVFLSLKLTLTGWCNCVGLFGRLDMAVGSGVGRFPHGCDDDVCDFGREKLGYSPGVWAAADLQQQWAYEVRGPTMTKQLKSKELRP
jgi:hypothetical protein